MQNQNMPPPHNPNPAQTPYGDGYYNGAPQVPQPAYPSYNNGAPPSYTNASKVEAGGYHPAKQNYGGGGNW